MIRKDWWNISTRACINPEFCKCLWFCVQFWSPTLKRKDGKRIREEQQRFWNGVHSRNDYVSQSSAIWRTEDWENTPWKTWGNLFQTNYYRVWSEAREIKVLNKQKKGVGCNGYQTYAASSLRLFWMCEIICDKAKMAMNMEEKSTKI